MVVAAFVRSAQVLTLYADILSDTYIPGFRPWGARGADDVAGYVRTQANLVLPVPDALLRPLLADTLYLVDTIGAHLAPEAGRARTADQREVASRRYLAVEELPLLAEAIETHRAAGVPAPCLAAGTVTKRLAAAWEPDDPLLGVAWHSVVVAAVGAMGERRDLERLRPALERWVAECDTEQRWCRNAALVGRLDTEELVPWSLPADRDHLASMISTVTSAALYVTSVLSGMRSSELHELTAGAARREARPGGAARYRVVSRRIKGEAFGGVEDSWVVLEDVYQALRIAEALTGAAPGELLFAKESNVAHARYVRLRSWINGPAGQRLGLMAIPDGPVNPRALRRTLALSIAQRPHGLIAAKVHLKHVSVATTEGYAARPGGHQAAFLAEVSAAEQAEHERLTVAAYHDYRRGVLPSGKGARELLACFEAVDRALVDHDTGPVTVIDDRRVERLLRAKAETLHVGVANYCWFSEPRKALCLKLAGTPDAAEPMIGMCDSARCPQATHHPEHRQAWADHANATEVTFLDNPRLSKPERARAQAVFDRATAVVAEIDQATTPDSDSDGR
ncbi:MAG: integrase [Actinomycetota bacterium]|nr:integrase [Actinomycetota bacterium]